MKIEGLEYTSGWYGQEQDELGQFRWMAREASLLIKEVEVPGKKYLHLEAGHTFPRKEYPILIIFINGHAVFERKIPAEFSSYLVPFEAVGDIRIEMKLNSVFKIPEDSRDLGIIVRNLELVTPAEPHIFYGEGWHGWEDGHSFRWIPHRAQLLISSNSLKQNQFLSFDASSEYDDFSQALQIEFEGKSVGEIPLIRNWNRYHCELHYDGWETVAGGSDKQDVTELIFHLNKLIPDEVRRGDTRELGIKIRDVSLHSDQKSYEDFLFFHKNALLNHKEMMGGKVELDSFPLYLGIDLSGKCNIKPPCVYCEWDWLKQAEGENTNTVVDDKTLENYGPFFSSARNLVNCSIGEPLIHPKIAQILDFCDRHDKILEMATNAQALSDKIIGNLVGKRIDLYVSLDASCGETYSKLRNDKWALIISNLTSLSKARKKAGNLPLIHMIFMPMRVNRNDIEGYFQLCQKIEADTLVLRPLNFIYDCQIEVERGGYHFNYEKEILSTEELEDFFEKCAELSKKYHVSVGNQFNFGLSQENGTQ